MKPGKITFLVLVCFFLSGVTGLIYEILWTRMIVEVIGSAPFAVSIILTVFMGGLGLGSYLAGRIIDRVVEAGKLVRIYAVLELVIGGYGLALPLLLVGAKPVFAYFYNQLYGQFMLYNFLTFIGCVILLGIPVICMGATLPVLCKFYIRRLSHLGNRAGRLYFLNTLGAALGALLCGFWLINVLGVRGTLIAVVCANGVIGLFCLVLSGSKSMASGAKEVVESPGVKSGGGQYPQRVVVGALVVFAISGFCGMAYEVMWTKLLGLIVGPTTYSFTIVLVTFIVGLAIGSAIFGYFADKSENIVRLLISCQVLAALSALFVSQTLGNSQLFFSKLIFEFKDHFAVMHLMKAGVLFGFMILPTICMGATFPLVGKIFTQSVSHVGRSLGIAYAINSVGSVAGSFCAGFLLVPLIGKENGLSVVVGIQLAAALVMTALIKDTKGKKRLFKSVPLAGAAFCGLLCCLFYPEWDGRLLAEGKYHRMDPLLMKHSWLESLFKGSEISGRHVNYELVFYGDGIGGFTTVEKRFSELGNTVYIMRNSGKADASSRGDMMTQCLLAHFPLMFHENAEKVLLVGLASGITAGEILHYPVSQLDVIEISQEVVKGSHYFDDWNNNIHTDDRANLIIQDGRAHLAMTNERYDVIISEPSNPWMAGLAALFTRDYFELAESKLNEKGIFVQFFHSYQMDWESFSMVGRTFCDVFENSCLVSTMPSEHSVDFYDFMLIGFNGDKGLSLENAEKNLKFAQKSKNVTLLNPKLFYRLVVSENLRDLFGEGLTNSDDRPLLEFAAPKLMYQSGDVIKEKLQSNKFLSDETGAVAREVLEDIDSRIDFAVYALSVYKPFLGMVDLEKATESQKKLFFELMVGYCSGNPIDYSLIESEELAHLCRVAQIDSIGKRISEMPDKVLSLLSLSELLFSEGRLEESFAACRNALQVDPDSAKAHRRMGYLLMGSGNAGKSVGYFEKALQLNPESLDVKERLAMAFVSLGRYEEGISYLEEILEAEPDSVKVLINLGLTLFSLGRYEEAEVYCRKVLELDPDNSSYHINLGVVLLRQDRGDEAIEYLKKGVAISPDDKEGQKTLGDALYQNERRIEAVSHYQEALRIAPDYAEAHYNLGLVLMQLGRLDEAIGHFKEALKIKPDYSEAKSNLEYALKKRGNVR